ncbi:MAG: glycosyltransferase family 4 protein [Endomicrobium sp.]|jgi:glycosyltransferase involved in cell wall biosynthesis|nr:glycosyltransferase family 4 protein [Endomicrobium sp.]
MKEYKVLHIFSSYSMGGAERAMLLLAKNLQKSKKSINIVAVPKNSKLFEQAVYQDFKTVHFKTNNSLDPFGILALVRIIKKYKINIVHVHQGKLYWTALFAKIFYFRIKVVFHRRQDTRHGFISKVHYYFADAVIAVSRAVAEGLIKYEKVPFNKISVIYNGVNFDKFNNCRINCDEIVKKYNLKNKIVVGTVGSALNFKGKGQIYLIEAAKILKNRYPQLRYLIVGDGKGIAKQKDYAKKLNVHDIVYFTGHQEQVQKFILIMNIFCLLSWHTEGMPNVVIEAQMLGKPVIVTNIGGNSESFINGITGVMVGPSNSFQVSEAIKKFVDNPNLSKQMGIAGKYFVKMNFSMDNMVNNILKVYSRITNSDFN